MALKAIESSIDHKPKRTSIGGGRIKTSSMNKDKKRSYKKYNGQGKRK
jgi:hypothetical protein